MPSLFDLNQQQRQLRDTLLEAFEESGGEITPEIEALLTEEIIQEHAVAEKFDGYGHVMASYLADIEFCKQREEHFAEVRKRAEKSRDAMKARLLAFMQDNGFREVQGDTFTFKRQANGGSQPLTLDVTDAASLPERFQKVRVSADTTAIRKALKSGEELEWARLEERGEHLRVR